MHTIQSLIKDRVIIFTTDAGFLLGTINAALQLCAQPDVMRIADIIIYLVDMADESIAALAQTFTEYPIQFVAVPPKLLTIPDGVVFAKTHVPRSTLVRLSLGGVIPTQYEHVVYLDGDIQILGDVLPMIAYTVAEKRIAAVSDALWLSEGQRGQSWKMHQKYLHGLGISDPRDYFNAGVLLFRRQTWLEYSVAALEFYVKNSTLCLYHDQSALNAVFLGHREIVSPMYNFVWGYANLGAQYTHPPKLIHFNAAGKPWFSSAWPWNGRFIPSYMALLDRFPILRRFHRQKSAAEIEAVDSDLRANLRTTLSRTPWRMVAKHWKFFRYMRDTNFVF